MTSLPQHAGRPKIQPWLRGWVEDEAADDRHLAELFAVEHSDVETSPKVIRDFFDAARPHSSELLEIETWRVLAWLKEAGRGCSKALCERKKAD